MNQAPLLDDDAYESNGSSQAKEPGWVRIDMLPGVLILIALAGKMYAPKPYWHTVMMLGAILMPLFMLGISLFLYKSRRYNKTQLAKSLIATVLMLAGLVAVWSYEQAAWNIGMGVVKWVGYACLGYAFFLMILWMRQLGDPMAGFFYRRILSRMVVFSALLLQLWTR
jgi:hypothetical protein